MKILVATSDVPFVEGGHRVLVRSLVRAFQEAGHEAEIFTTPQNRFGRQFSAYLATRITDVGLTGNGEKVDRLITTRFPAYALKHPHHTCWLIHRMREYYDLWPQWKARLSWKGRIKESIRRTLIHKADARLLKHNVRKVFALSRTVQAGLLQWGNIPSEPLYPPPAHRNYHTEEYGDFVFCPCRLTPLKRVHLLVEALAQTKTGKAVIAGEGSEREAIIRMIREKSMENRIEMRGHVDDETLADLYARCRAVFYAPVNEDFGMVTLEAFRSRKAVITAQDSGGCTEVVRDGASGFVVPPDPSQIAQRITSLVENPSLAEKMGTAGYEDSKHITWPHTVSRLLAD